MCAQKTINAMADSNPKLRPGVVFDLRPSTPEARVQAFLDVYKWDVNDNTDEDVDQFRET